MCKYLLRTLFNLFIYAVMYVKSLHVGTLAVHNNWVILLLYRAKHFKLTTEWLLPNKTRYSIVC